MSVEPFLEPLQRLPLFGPRHGGGLGCLRIRCVVVPRESLVRAACSLRGDAVVGT